MTNDIFLKKTESFERRNKPAHVSELLVPSDIRSG